MAEHPDSLWQPWPDEARRGHDGRPEPRSCTTRGRPAQPEPRTNRAMGILEERYARGEIDRCELEERRAVLQAAGT